MLDVCVTNLGKYNEGYLIYERLNIPYTEEELKNVLDKIGINEEYEEYFISDYEWDTEVEYFYHYWDIGEYENLSTLNEQLGKLEYLEDYEREAFMYLYGYQGMEFNYSLEHLNDVTVYDVDNFTDLAYEIIEECGGLSGLPEHLQYYFDYETYGRDLSYEGFNEFNGKIFISYD